MLLADSLSNEIVSNLNHSVMCLTYLSSIKSYVESNIIINATYVGVTPTGMPDPLNGPIQLVLTLTPSMIAGQQVIAFLKSLKEPNPNSFIQAVFSELIADVISGPPTHTLTAKAIYQINSLSGGELDSLKKASDYVQAWKIICVPIIKTFLTLQAVPPSIPTITASGTGVTTITKVL